MSPGSWGGALGCGLGEATGQGEQSWGTWRGRLRPGGYRFGGHRPGGAVRKRGREACGAGR